jgi:formylglycine-generating enzyme required for sulfatase activity
MLKHILLVSVLLAGVAGRLQAITIDTVPVGNIANAGDPAVMNDGTSGYGSVAYEYRIGTTEVTNAQYSVFLNAKDPNGTNILSLYHSLMGLEITNGGISFVDGNAAGNKYQVIVGNGENPVNYVTWYDAIRFVNWLNNGQGNSDTETGAYTLLGGTPTPSNAASITRNPDATVFLPNENEWYKAAYYNPVNGSYFAYPTSNDNATIPSSPPGGSNSANNNNILGGPIAVGSYNSSVSPYGTFDQGGNVMEWNEAFFGAPSPDGPSRGLRGGGFLNPSIFLNATARGRGPAIDGLPDIGFRVAMVPEPSSFILATCGIIGLAACRWSRKRARPRRNRRMKSTQR